LSKNKSAEVFGSFRLVRIWSVWFPSSPAKLFINDEYSPRDFVGYPFA